MYILYIIHLSAKINCGSREIFDACFPIQFVQINFDHVHIQLSTLSTIILIIGLFFEALFFECFNLTHTVTKDLALWPRD